jgi:hypothetical protein
MDQLREQLQVIKHGLEAGQVSLHDYLAAMRGQVVAMSSVIGNVPLMAETMGAGPEVVARLEELAAEMIGDMRRVIGEES